MIPYLTDTSMSTSSLPPSHPDQPEEELPALPERIPDEDVDKPQREFVIQVRGLESDAMATAESS